MVKSFFKRYFYGSDGVYTSSNYVQRELFKRVEKIVTQQKLYLDSTLTLEGLAEKVGTNRTYLCECFRAQNTTYKKYIDKHRVNHLVKLINDSNSKISDGNDLARFSGFVSRRSMDTILMNNIGKTYYDLIRKNH